MKSLKKYWWVALIIILAFIGLRNTNDSSGDYASFATCLTESGAKMYGAFWCGHCEDQKKDFGDSWQYINYIECSLPNGQEQTEICSNEGITGYPTWEFGEGTRLSGRLSVEQLSQNSGCEL